MNEDKYDSIILSYLNQYFVSNHAKKKQKPTKDQIWLSKELTEGFEESLHRRLEAFKCDRKYLWMN